jgi:hypothetical protein
LPFRLTQKQASHLTLSEQQIESLSPNPAAFQAGKKLSVKEQWQNFSENDRVIWGEIKGSGKSPYLTQIDKLAIAYKCTCPSRQFPCKHSIALMLLYLQNRSSFQKKEEPEWVKSWMDKRGAKEQQKSAEPVERTAEEEEQLEKNREKTQVNRLASVMAGVAELELWLKDLVRMGFLELPTKPKTEFEKVAARMVDAKAPGLAGWVKALGRLDYGHSNEWQQEALKVTAKLFLLIRTLKNYEQLDLRWQHTVRNLAGWSQSTKELLADPEAETVKDEWLVAGQEVETTDDDITIQRNWLIGCLSNRKALILNFGTKYTTLENNVLPGTIIEGELAFFPSVLPQRAAFKMQRKVLNVLASTPSSFDSWESIYEHKSAELKINPWANDHLVMLRNARMVSSQERWFVCDEHRSAVPVVTDFSFEKTMKWLVNTGNRTSDMALVIRNDHALPLGIVSDNLYNVL